jgi:hypothetical protein
MLERINMPLYMIGRFNLKIDLIYQGIILGTGPQVDPGFRGRLSCPLHNISNNDVVLTFGERFATIDFVKTSLFAPAPNVPNLAGLTRQQIYQQFADEGLPGFHGHPLVLFPGEKLERRVLDDYLPAGKTFKSSLQELESALKAISRYNIGILVGAFAVLLSFVIGGATIGWNQFQYFKFLRDSLEQQIIRVGVLTENRDRLLEQLKDMDARLSRIEGAPASQPSSARPVYVPPGTTQVPAITSPRHQLAQPQDPNLRRRRLPSDNSPQWRS